MKKTFFAFTAITSLLFISCEKDEDTSIDVESTPTPSPSGDYFPMSEGNSWTYEGGLNYKTSISEDTIIGGFTYYKVNNNQGGNGYMRKNGDDYLLIDSVSYGDWNPIVILKEAASAGDSWEFTKITTNPGFTTTSEYTFSIFEKKSTMTINGVVYNDILVIDLDLDIYMEGSYIGSVNDSRYYYAKGVGLISSQITGAENTNLKTYKVN